MEATSCPLLSPNRVGLRSCLIVPILIPGHPVRPVCCLPVKLVLIISKAYAICLLAGDLNLSEFGDFRLGDDGDEKRFISPPRTVVF